MAITTLNSASSLFEGSDSAEIINVNSGAGSRSTVNAAGGNDTIQLLGPTNNATALYVDANANADFISFTGTYVDTTLIGGAGSDTYKLSRGHDVVRGFEVGVDIIQAPDIPELSQQGRHVLLSYPGGTTLLRKTALDDVAVWLTPEAGGLELLA